MNFIGQPWQTTNADRIIHPGNLESNAEYLMNNDREVLNTYDHYAMRAADQVNRRSWRLNTVILDD